MDPKGKADTTGKKDAAKPAGQPLSLQEPVEEYLQVILNGAMGDSVRDKHRPTDEVEDGDTVVGVLDKRAQTAYILREVMQEKVSGELIGKTVDALQAAFAARLTGPAEGKKGCSFEEMKAELEDVARATYILDEKRKMLDIIFWALVYQQFGKEIPSEHSIGIREGWHIVHFKAKQPSVSLQLVRLQ